jgi:hypothetical protein
MPKSPPDSDLGFAGIGKRLANLKSKPEPPDIENQRDQLSSETPSGDNSSLKLDKETPCSGASRKSDYCGTTAANFWMIIKKQAKLIIVIVIVGIGIIVLLANKQENKNKTNNYYQTSKPSQQIYSSPTRQFPIYDKPDETTNSLRTKIETGRSQIKTLELELKFMTLNIEELKTTIAKYKTLLGHQEQQARLGEHIEEYVYQSNLNEHNRFVRKYNNALSTYNTTFTKYDKLIEQDKYMVKQHNKLLKR